MIIIKEFPEKQFSTKEEMFKALRENKQTLIAQKKMITKEADSIAFSYVAETNKGEVIKSDSVDVSMINELKMDLVINTTNVMDSHSDVHMKGIWNKSLKEKKDFYLLQEHKMKFSNIITDEVLATAKQLKWSEVGASYKGDTEALIFSVVVNKQRNPYMFEQYAKGFVKNHSVGMRYVKLELALNSDSKWDEEEKLIWDKYISEVANKKEAEDQGYFWAVTEAKIVEGSAVPIGSNRFTPTLNVNIKEAEKSLSKTEAEQSLQEVEKLFNYLKI